MTDWLAARAELASGVARELAQPLDRIHATLATVVERLDRHVAASRGPEPLSWQAVGDVREHVAEVYLEIGRARRLAAALGLLAAPVAPRRSDVNEIVEQALTLARHRFAGDGDALVDLGTTPPIVVDPARMTQTVALLVVHAAEVAGSGAVTVATGVAGREVTLSISAAGDARPLPFADAIRAAVAADGGRLELGEPGFACLVALPAIR
jgi:signal transduction histidine kinase